MLFNSYGYIFAFLPAALIGFYLAACLRRQLAKGWLIAASLFFYGWWNAHFVALLVCSIAFNYVTGALIASTIRKPRLQALLVAGGVTGNLAVLFFYKYLFTLFAFLGLLDTLPATWAHGIILPLGISFFTFTQIGYLVDAAAGLVKRHGLLDYVLFVTFFPHLIAGPILHNQEMIPQFADPKIYRFRISNLAVGLSMFVLGLCKKVVIADPLGRIADQAFASPHLLSTHGAWQGVLSYSLQLYFDFSGYSDMAIGSARMFGILFPVNFNSPYKSRSVIDFWQRWHMTLTRYLTLYLYNPVALRITRRRVARGLGVSRRDMRHVSGFASIIVVPTFFTIVLAGIWHGAGLQFLIFGLLHACYLSINHAWRVFGAKRGGQSGHVQAGPAQIVASLGITYIAVIIAQVFFRAASAQDAATMLGGMAGLHAEAGSFLVPDYLLRRTGELGQWVQHWHLVAASPNATDLKAWFRILTGFILVWAFPNTQQIMSNFKPVLGLVKPPRLALFTWAPNVGWGLVIGAMLICSLYGLDDAGRFLYFQF